MASGTPLVENGEVPSQIGQPESKTLEEQCVYFAARRDGLTPTERTIYHFYLAEKTTKEIMAELNIKESTLKYHYADRVVELLQLPPHENKTEGLAACYSQMTSPSCCLILFLV